MNLDHLYKILKETTIQLRKGEMIHGNGVAVTFDMMPPVAEAASDLEKVDMEFLVVGVHKTKAEHHRADLIDLLKTYPNPERLAGGPSYIEVGGVIGDQSAAFQLFALGKVLGLWGLITPASFGMEGEEARRAAGSGFIMMTGYKAAA